MPDGQEGMTILLVRGSNPSGVQDPNLPDLGCVAQEADTMHGCPVQEIHIPLFLAHHDKLLRDGQSNDPIVLFVVEDYPLSTGDVPLHHISTVICCDQIISHHIQVGQQIGTNALELALTIIIVSFQS